MRTIVAFLLSSISVLAAPALPGRGFVQEYDSVVQALATSPQQISTTYEIKGLFAINDGEGGSFHYYAGDTTATNATDCFEWGSGRLRRYYLGVTASRVNVFGSSTNTADNLNLDSYLRLGYVVPGLGAGTVAVFDANGLLTNGVASGFISAGDGITVSGSTVSTDLAEGSNITLSTNGSGTITISGVAAGTTINPTDLYIPVRDSATTFINSPLHTPSSGSTNTIIDGQLIWGPGQTNVLYRVGGYLVYTNGSTAAYPGYQVVGGDGTTARLVAGGNLAVVQGTLGVELWDSVISGNELRWTGNALLPIETNSIFGGLVSLGLSTPPIGIVVQQTNIVHGYQDGAANTNYSRLAIRHTGTNGVVMFDSQSMGVAGDPESFNFATNGSSFLNVGWLDNMVRLNPLGGKIGIAIYDSGSRHVDLWGGLFVPSTDIQLGTENLPWGDLYLGPGHFGYFSGFSVGGGVNYSRLAINHTGTNGAVVFDSQSLGTAGPPRPFSFNNAVVYIQKNVGALLSAGDSAFVDLSYGAQTNAVSGAIAIAHATNGVHGLELTHIRSFFNGSGSDQTLTIPSGWKTNALSAVPPALTNGVVTKMYVRGMGPTDDAASQTNCYVSFEYF